ncbi:tetratricopeptide repeat protein [Amycolatopsis sp. NBC_00438]|uniref:tetratricopeptide repeat protein n=1 Tax=Amycolatopsis sp. NBC_00438 TaxID=2903558 RepID=UPI003FA46B1C
MGKTGRVAARKPRQPPERAEPLKQITTYEVGLTISRELGDRYGEGIALNNLGLALQEVRQFEEAITAYQQAGVMFRELGDRQGEGGACTNFGVLLREVRLFDEAITVFQQAKDLSRSGRSPRRRPGTGQPWTRAAGGAAVRRSRPGLARRCCCLRRC